MPETPATTTTSDLKSDERLSPPTSNNLSHAQNSTLLPSSMANVVSLITRSSSLYLRLGTFIGGLALDGARVTTLTSLELSRSIIENILLRSGRDVSLRSTGVLGQAEAEGLLRRSIETLHATITSISFAASTGFYISAAALESGSDLSQQLLASLDSILGSTDSSRAIASIITLIQREFQNPATGREGEKVGVGDLLIGICGLALLQKWCTKLTEAERREKMCEEMIWDVVVLNDGRRVDVAEKEEALTKVNSARFMTPDNGLLANIDREAMIAEESDDDMPEINLKQILMQSLPSDASVSITTETMALKTITVEVTGAQFPDFDLPHGIEIVEDSTHHGGVEEISTHDQSRSPTSRYRMTYRIMNKRVRGTNIKSQGTIDSGKQTILDDVDIIDTAQPSPEFVHSPLSSPGSEAPPELPPKDNSASKGLGLNSSLLDERKKGSPPILSTNSSDIAANQKRSRKLKSSSSSLSGSDIPISKRNTDVKPQVKKSRPDRPPEKPIEKKGSFRNALKKGSSTAISNIWTRDQVDPGQSKSTPQRPPWGVSASTSAKSELSAQQRQSGVVLGHDAPRPPQRGNPNFFSSRDLGLMQSVEPQRSPSRTSYYSVHEPRRDSFVSQTDTYSIHSAETRPGSPTTFRTHLRAQSSIVRARSEKNIASQSSSPAKLHRRSKSHVPSIYTLRTNNSGTSLVLANQPHRSVLETDEALSSLKRYGMIDGLFPHHHLVRNISRFVRFASASYGSSFLRVMGITTSAHTTREIDTKHHHEHHSFSNHTQLPADTILLSSFVDPAGGTDSSGHTGTGIPMVHFVSLDHESKAVVLTCRGTLGFEDVLTDMTCDYDILSYQGKGYSVHKGIHASARRLLDGGGSRVMLTITAALEELPDYGLVLCGHSLGGGVTSLLAIMISEPSAQPDSTSFVTASSPNTHKLLTASSDDLSIPSAQVRLPPGRPIHVYTYGPPATLSSSLRLATRGLITTVVNGQDLVPYLSLGILHDLQAVALVLKTDDSNAKGELQSRVWDGLKGNFADRWYNKSGNGGPGSATGDEDDQWAYSALKTLRASMLSSKLVPPGEVFVVEASPVLQRDAFVSDTGEENRGLGRPATRSILRYVRDVESRFGEIRFGGSMLLDHSPGRYEASLGALGRGVLG